MSSPSTRARPRLAFLLSIVGLASALGAAEPIRLGEIEPLTGKEAAFGQASRRGVQMAVAEINARGGVLGRPIVVVVEDNQSKAGDSATIAKKLVSRDKVVGLISGGTSSNCVEIGPVAQAARVPFVATTATAAKVTELGSFVFRNCFIDEFQAQVMSKFARGSLKLRRVALLSSSSSIMSVGLARAFRESFTRAGGEIAVDQRYAEGDKDFRAQLTAIKNARADGIFVPGYYTEAALICRQARELGLTQPIFGSDGWEAPELVQIGGAAVEGTYYCSHYSSESTAPAVVEFVRKYRAAHGGETPDSMAPLAYDAAMILLDAIARAGTTDGARVREALAATRDFPGVTGRTTIDARRNASKSAVIVVVKNGQAAYLETIDP